ncbi:hypothetical protein DL766_002491 [Monosporascus sp. MC13-8B]|uniref:Coenzyme Q-binding protein COQ10 START domain-containing protein n=1 Tax=Monosporascus cannonballus TaxID=155416 RepID=A0ABY0HGE8_9PEZI|nr:hypothetical protein DL762_002836 [Monosporascus cannonballus]RYO95573.1 hypothetical protein DL763_003643 [Monosporascus cannonballus]RYP35480.1 hypothetical protein DL766_002491 [Monosporascus sp. MC13-8B]
MAETIPPNQEPKWADSPLASPTYGVGGKATIVSSATIAAPPATCVEITLDPGTYPSWNKFVPRVTVQSPPSRPLPESTPPAVAQFLKESPGRQLLFLGTRFRFEVHMDPDSASGGRIQHTDLEVSVLEEFERGGKKGLRVAWKIHGDLWYLKAERTQEFLERPDGGCDYVGYETFYGPLTWLVKRFAGPSLLRGFMLWMDGLKKAAEEKAAQQNAKAAEEDAGAA